MRRRTLVLYAVALVVLPIWSSAQTEELPKKKITSINELPRYTYEISSTVTELITSRESFAPFAAQVRANIEELLATYEIEDKTTLRRYYGTLVALDMLEGNYDKAVKGIERVRELQEKPASRLLTGLINRAIVQARQEVGENDTMAFRQAFSRHLSQVMEKLPWEIVQERIEELKGSMELVNKNFLLGIIQSEFEPVVEKTGKISGEIAERVISMRYLIDVRMPVRNEVLHVFEKYITANRIEKANIWHDRDIDLSEEQGITPVVIAIWDTGTDIDVFPDRLFVNAKETLNGKDDDENGFVDDIHGIAYDVEEEKTEGILYPLHNAKQRLPEMKNMMKGLFDMMAALDSPEAQALRQKIAGMTPEEVNPFMEDLMQFALYVHGTHVGGVAVEGNPAARILSARFTIDYHTIPDVPTVEKAQKAAQSYTEAVAYFKTHGVRVVNMSWGGTLRETEDDLEKNGVGKDAEERLRLAREIFDIERHALYAAIKDAPEILFVNAAGNENDDVAFEDYYPTSFDLPNVLVVGAVDQAGDETSFTSFGERVDVYANGYEVDGYLPGGDRMEASGTSVSAPQVTNLAAKLLAIEPSLTTEDVAALIKDGASWNEDGRFLLINPQRSVELLRSSRDM